MNYFIDVVLPIPVNQVFTYGINEAEYSFLRPGMRVAVPFGKKKIYTSIVSSVHTNSPTIYEVKPIYQIIDEKPLINGLGPDFKKVLTLEKTTELFKKMEKSPMDIKINFINSNS